MAGLTARFSLIDEMSDKIANMANAGQNMLESWERAGTMAGSAIDGITSSATQTVSTIDGVTHSISDLQNTANGAESAASGLYTAISEFSSAVDNAVIGTDNWTAAAQTYDKTALEMVYTTEELVDMGLKSADALREQEEMFSLCEQSEKMLSDEMQTLVSVQEEFASAVQKSDEVMRSLSDNERVSAEVKEHLEQASQAASQAIQELTVAEDEARAAMENYKAVISSGTTDLNELESAAERAGHAAEALAQANAKASSTTEELAKATDEASDSAEKSGKSGIEAVEGIANALAAAGITAVVKEIAASAYELADAFSEAEKIVVNATGATGGILDGLEESMLAAYSNNDDSLADTAGAIGEINTRIGLTGEKLTNVTGLFLDYADITSSDVVGSVQNVTKVMNQWGVEMDDVESVLDRLAYAGQISGASVDTLSNTLISGAVSFQEVGLSLDSAIKLLCDFELAGISSTTAITAMRTAVNGFSSDGLDAETALQSVIIEIANMESTADATALAVDTFGSKAGQQLASAIRNGTVSVESFSSTLEEADGTLKKTAEAGESLGEKWEKSSNKVKTAFTSALQPSIDKFSSGFADVMGKFGDFLNQHPVLTKALTAIGIGLGAAALAIAGVAAASLTAIPAVAALGTAIHAALGPIGWIAAGATAVAGGIMLLNGAFSDTEEVEDYSGTLAECANEISMTEAAYVKACELYGENSSAAQSLSDQLDLLNAQYEKGGGAIAEYVETATNAAAKLDELAESEKAALAELDASNTSGYVAVSMLESLSSKAEITNTDLDLMSKYADYLNDTFNCNIEVNYDTGKLTGFDPTNIASQIESMYQEKKVAIAIEAVSNVDFVDSYKEISDSYEKAAQEYQQTLDKYQADAEAAYQDYVKAAADYGNDIGSMSLMNSARKKWEELQKPIDDAAAALDTCQSELTEADAELKRHCDTIDSSGELFYEMQKNITGASDAFSEHESVTESALSATEEGIQAASEAWEKYRTDIESLCDAYDEVYQSALESFESQFGLFDKATTESETYMNSTVANAQVALDSQLAYWTEYEENLNILESTTADKLGVTQEQYDAFMQYVQSGSEEAAGLMNDAADLIKSNNTEALTNVIETNAKVAEKRETLANETAEWATDFSSKLDDLEEKMNQTIDNMDLSPEANKAATATMNNYTNALRTGGEKAVAAAQIVANQISSILSSINTTVNIGLNASGSIKSVQKNAKGTTNAEDVFIAGEEGPELIIGKAGSTVFPTSETNKIVSAVSALDGIYKSPYSESITYGDNHILENSYNYDTDYDNSRIIETVTNYGDTIKNVEENYMPSTDVSQTLQDSVISVFIPRLEMIQSILQKSLSDNLSGIEACNNAPDISVAYTVDQSLPEYVPSEQDNRILSPENDNRIVGVNEDEAFVMESQMERSSEESGTSENVKKIVIEIAGNGQIDITDGVDKQQVLEILQDNLKPVLMNIIQSEIYEEGELSYDY